MACDANTNRVANLAGRISGAISRLSSKQAFLAGVAVGASGTGLGAFLMARRQRIALVFRDHQKKGAPGWQSWPRPKPEPVPALSAHLPPRPKPKPVPGLPGASSAKPIPGLPALADAAVSQTKLQAAPVRVLDHEGKAFTAQDSYRVVRPDGSDTGLAITPYLEQGDDNSSTEKPDAWSVTHTSSGALIDGPYPTIAQAQGLATKLSALRWTASPVPKADVDRAKALIGPYRQRLEGIKTE